MDRIIGFIKKNYAILIMIAAGAMLLMLPTGRRTAAEPVKSEKVFSVEAEEARLREVLEAIDGVGEVRVLLSVRGTEERIVAEDSGSVRLSGGEAITLRYVYPEYTGAVVVAEGAGKTAAALKITEAVQAFTGLGTDKIKVISGGNKK